MARSHDLGTLGTFSKSLLHMRYFIYCRKSSEAEDRQVLSIESQLTTLQRTFGASPDIEIAEVFEESFSAKSPGRKLFGDMMRRIERGDADGIIAWAPDRLARNSIDGGQIVYLLDRGVIKDLKFATCTFENNPQGKFMLQIMFGQSKYYSDALSENVKRGNRTKIEKGWRPSQAPLGYCNDKETKTTVPDETHFPLIRKMYSLMLTGTYTTKQIAVVARDEWGFVTPLKKRMGGKPLENSTVHRILTNPFYAGIIEWDGRKYPGKHAPVVTVDEFSRVREILRRPGVPRPQRHRFAFTGMIRCGGCGLMVTAEHKVKPSGRAYTYYHCSRRQMGPRCAEPAITLENLESDILAFLTDMAMQKDIEAWVIDAVVARQADREREQNAQEASLVQTLDATKTQLSELTGLRLRNLISDDEFLRLRQGLEEELLRLKNHLNEKRALTRLEPVQALISFSNKAVFCFRNGNVQQKRLILQTVGWNSTLVDGKLNVEAAKPFFSSANFATNPRRSAFIDDVLTYAKQDDPHSNKVFENLKLIEAFDQTSGTFDDGRSDATSPTSPSP